MSRCSACNKIMSGAEMHTNTKTNEPEDLCTKCLGVVYEAVPEALPTSNPHDIKYGDDDGN